LYLQEKPIGEISSEVLTDSSCTIGWANGTGFPPGKPTEPGLDPLIGTVASGDVNMREMFGLSIGNPTEEFIFNQWIVPKGGEYFFVPSISTLRDVFAKAGSAKQSEL